jgi:hypothetical protein
MTLASPSAIREREVIPGRFHRRHFRNADRGGALKVLTHPAPESLGDAAGHLGRWPPVGSDLEPFLPFRMSPREDKTG